MTKLKTIIAIASVFAAANAFATTHVETGDAGQTLATAQTLAGGTDTITGSVQGGEADIFKFNWNGGAFYANTVGTNSFDSQLFLFDSTGAGVQANDDGIAFAGPAYLQLGNLIAGIYYLAMSGFDFDPYSASGIMFQSNPYGPLYGPLNGSESLAGWAGGSGGGQYVINFRQTTSNGTPIGDPNPTGGNNVPDAGSTLGLFGVALAGLAAIRRRK